MPSRLRKRITIAVPLSPLEGGMANCQLRLETQEKNHAPKNNKRTW